jgi:hypothetical protein
LRQIARHVSLSKDAVARHRTHIDSLLIRARKARKANDTDSLSLKLAELSQRARRLADAAERNGDMRAGLMGVRELGRILEIEAKLAGRIESSKVEVNLNSIKVDLVTDEQIEAFLQRLDQDRRSRIVGRQINCLITDTDVERLENSLIAHRLGVTPDELGHLREWIAEYRNTRGADDY